MTSEQQDAVLGRLMRERKEAETRRTALEAEAQRIGANLIDLGQALQRHPSTIQAQGEGLEAEHIRQARWIAPAELEEVKQIVPLANEYRETMKTLQRLSRQLAEAGWK
ncbi:MAG: hypothetical protein WA708_13225 [Acidobacteriaceae bacterium]